MNMIFLRQSMRRWRLIPILALVFLLGACSMISVAYHRAPTLMYWRLDTLFDLSGEQSALLRPALQDWHAWHRSTHLPQYANALQQWQTLATQDLTAEQVCQVFDQIRRWAVEAGEQLLPAIADIAPTLSPAQLEHWKRHQAKQTESFIQDFGPAGVVSEARHRRAVERAEMLYGPLTDEQRRWWHQRLARSAFDVYAALAERERRFALMQEAVRQVQAGADAERILRAVLAEFSMLTSPGYSGYTHRMLADSCVQLAELHNQTTPEQRRTAVEKLQGFERDILTLSAS